MASRQFSRSSTSHAKQYDTAHFDVSCCSGSLVGLLETKGRTPAAQPGIGAADPHRALLNTYRGTCRNASLKTSGLAFDVLPQDIRVDGFDKT
jgi:hypothetical protein